MPDHVEDMKAGRVVVSELQAGGSCVWYYEDGLLKNQVPAEGWEGDLRAPGPRRLLVWGSPSQWGPAIGPERQRETHTGPARTLGRGRRQALLPWAIWALL